MTVHMKREVSDEKTRFIIYDEKGDLKYRIRGRFSKSIDRLSVKSGDKTLAAIVEINPPIGVLRAFRITKGHESFNMLITGNRSSFVINFFGISFKIRGDVVNNRYSIIDIDGSVQANIHEDFIRRYTDIEIINENREIFCIAVAACISSIGFTREYKMQKA